MTVNPTATLGASLTAREREVVELLAVGNSHHQIALYLKLSCSTVYQYAHQARLKFGAVNTAHLVALWVREETS